MQGWFLLFALLFGSMGAGADGGSLQDQVRTAYRGKVLTLRQFYDAEKLHFGTNGHLVGEATTGPWTVDGQLQVTDIHLQSGMLQIKGKRLTLVFDPTTKKLRDLMEISPKQSIMEGHIFRGRKRRERAREARVLEVDLELPAAAKLMTDVESAMSVAFLSPNDDLVDFVPEFGKILYCSRKASLRTLLRQVANRCTSMGRPYQNPAFSTNPTRSIRKRRGKPVILETRYFPWLPFPRATFET